MRGSRANRRIASNTRGLLVKILLGVAVLLAGVSQSRGGDAEDASALAARLSGALADRRQAIYGLWKQGNAAGPVLASIAKVLGDDDEYVRTVADRILGQFADQGPLRATIPVLLMHMSDSRPCVRRLAVTNLWRAGPVGDPPPAGYEDALVAAARDSDPLLRANAVATLGETHILARRNAALLLESSRDTDPQVRLWATISLGHNCVDMHPDELLRLVGDVDPRVRIVAIQAFASNRRFEPEVGPALLRGMRDEDPLVRDAAVEAVIAQEGVTAIPMAIPLLFKTLDKEAGQRRTRAVVALGALGDPRALGPLSRLLDTSDPDLLPVVVDAVARLGPEARYAANRLLPLLSHDDPGIVRAAARAVAPAAGLDHVVNARLLAAARQGDSRHRAAILLGLGSSHMSKGEALAGVLESALGSPERHLRVAAARAQSALRISAPGMVEALGTALAREGRDGEVEPFLWAIAPLGQVAESLTPIVLEATSGGSVHRTLADVTILSIATSAETRTRAIADLVRVLGDFRHDALRASAWRTVSHAPELSEGEVAALDEVCQRDRGMIPEASLAIVAVNRRAPSTALDEVVVLARAGDEDAIRVLGRVGARDSKAIGLLMGLYRVTRRPSSRGAIIDALATIPSASSDASAIWLEGLSDPSSVVRHASFRALRGAGWIR